MRVHVLTAGVPYDSNVYLVESDRTMLVDAGTGEAGDMLVSRIRGILGQRPLDYAVATHCHYDHVGGLSQIVEEFGCRAFACPPDSDRIRSGDPRYVLSDMFGGAFHPVDVEDLRGGDVLHLGGCAFDVIATPGHTEGGICLHDPESGTLFSGDTLFETGIGRTDFPGGSMLALRSSLRYLSNIHIRGLYPGHGNVCERYAPAMLARVLTLVGV